MRTVDEQLDAVRHRLLMANPQFRELVERTGIADGILLDMVRHFHDAPEGPFIRILTLWTQWKADLGLGQRGGYDTFITYVARQERDAESIDRASR